MNTDPALWTKRPAFGVAGGPDAIVLSEEGLARAFTVGAKVKRGPASSALEALAACGGFGLLDERTGVGARIRPTALGKFDQCTWGYLREKGYVESVYVPGYGVRLTEAGKRAVQDGQDEQVRLLERCKGAAS